MIHENVPQRYCELAFFSDRHERHFVVRPLRPVTTYGQLVDAHCRQFLRISQFAYRKSRQINKLISMCFIKNHNDIFKNKYISHYNGQYEMKVKFVKATNAMGYVDLASLTSKVSPRELWTCVAFCLSLTG